MAAGQPSDAPVSATAPEATSAGPEFDRRVEVLGAFRYSVRALALVWTTSRALTVTLAVLTVFGGVLPAATAYVGKVIVDAVVAADRAEMLRFVLVEGVLVGGLAAVQRGLWVCGSLLRARLGHRVNMMILEKALTLQLSHFEDSEFYDKLVRARRQASERPMSLVRRTFGLLQNAVSLLSLAGLLWGFSPWAVLILPLAGLPAFVAEAKFSQDAFRLSRWRSPQARQQAYIETVLAREDYVKEVKLFGLGPLLLGRYNEIFDMLFGEDRRLAIRRGGWTFLLGLLGTGVFYGAYVWIGLSATSGDITLGQMTMYLMVFKQGQSSVSSVLSAVGGMYEDNLYLSNLYEYLEQPVPDDPGRAIVGTRPGDGVRFERVSFRYPGATTSALHEVDLHLMPGQAIALVGDNGSGKTTLIKLLTCLYQPTGGRITFDGLDVREWDKDVLRRRIGVIFQDFARYQMLVGENIGAGDVEHFEDEPRWASAASRGMASDFVEGLDLGYRTQLGRWFKDGRELSGGQWQRIALARAFMREDAEVLVLDEPTAAMDAEAEAAVFENFRAASAGKIIVLISHRFSTVRGCDQIVVLAEGRVEERGTHEQLLASGGRYARLFRLQAMGYR